mgnify:CR=1 FL=1
MRLAGHPYLSNTLLLQGALAISNAPKHYSSRLPTQFVAKKQFRHRGNVRFPLHSQRISGELFDRMELTIPRVSLANLRVLGFWPKNSAAGRKASRIRLNNRLFDIQLHTQTKGRKSPLHRIWTTPELRAEMKRTFLATYARHLEAKLRQNSGGDYDELSIESFHEFVDIEFDTANNLMIWTPHFVVEPTYKELFNELADNTALYLIDSSIKGKAQLASSDWKPRANPPSVKKPNVIYYLRDDENQLFYVGKGGSGTGTDRIFDEHPTISNWTHYRYDVLPPNFNNSMVEAFEQMQIRVFAYLLKNNPSQGSQRSHPPAFSGYTLTNLKIIP